MMRLDVNFSEQAAKRRFRRDLFIIAISIVVILFVSDQMASFDQFNNNEAINRAKMEQQMPISQSLEISPQEMKLAIETANSLNRPWYKVFSALEAIKNTHPNVYIKTLLPDIHKQELMISGEVADLNQFLEFVDALNHSPTFTRVLPMNQQRITKDGQTTAFTVKVWWKHE